MMHLLLLTFTLNLVRADMYLQSVRGSNNRLDEANRERNNGNRLFDSQNNDRGGYNVGKLNYFATEKVPISWTNQHGCGSEDVKHCEIILQAMCDPLMRDGTTTQRIPVNPANCRNFDCDTDPKFGRHESYEFYQTCEQTERNKGLFVASQQPNRGDATRTRQNPGGTRRGYECPEERDYYPYWNPSPWIDLAIWTKDMGKCQAMQAESQNVKSKWYCNVPDEVKEANNFGNGIGKTPISQAACDDLNTATVDNGGNSTTLRAEWTEVPPNGFPAPQCLESRPTRPNHLGLIGGKTQWTYEWEVPKEFLAGGAVENRCAFRVRYNITEDYDASKRDGSTAEAGMDVGLGNPDNSKFTTLEPGIDFMHSRTSSKGGNANNRPSTLQIWRKYGISDNEVADYTEGDRTTDPPTPPTIGNVNDNNLGTNRDYLLRNNPKPDVLGKTYGNDDFRVRLQLAVNTAQYCRTFQDRTHMTRILARPANAGNSQIKLLTVSGKRGNIVQTFPGHEYFFFPEELHLKKFDMIHLHWTGSNTNPNNNDGQGKQGTDRSNLCPMNNAIYPADAANSLQGGDGLNAGLGHIGSLGVNYPAYVKEPELYARAEAFSTCGAKEQVQAPIGGIPMEIAEAVCTGRREPGALHDYGNMEELDDAGTTVSFAPVQVTETGCWSVVSTRNNNFSNRCQKSTICVDEGDYATNDVGPQGDAVSSGVGWIAIPSGAVSNIQTFSMSSAPKENAASEEVWIEPYEMDLTEEGWVEVAIAYEQRALYSPKLTHQNHQTGSWEELTDAKYETATNPNGEEYTVAMANVNEGGAYVVEDQVNAGAVVAIVMAGLVFFCAVGFLVWWKFFKTPSEEYDEYATNPASVQTGTYA